MSELLIDYYISIDSSFLQTRCFVPQLYYHQLSSLSLFKMSRPVGAPSGPPGFPPFEPPLSALSALSSEIQTSITEYENAKTPKEKAAALQKVQASSNKLSRTTTPIQQQFMQINFGPNVNVAIRIGVEMGLFVSYLFLSLHTAHYCRLHFQRPVSLRPSPI